MRACRVTTWTRKDFIKYFGIYVAALIVFIVIGALGPETGSYSTAFAYNCKNKNGNPEHHSMMCMGGVDMNTNNTFTTELGGPDGKGLSPLNRGWALIVGLYNTEYTSTGIMKNLDIETRIEGRNGADQKWTPLEKMASLQRFEKSTQSLVCQEGSPQCQNFTLATEEYINYAFYRVSVAFTNAANVRCINGNCTTIPMVGDVQFTFVYLNAGFGTYQLVFRIIFLVASVIVLIWMWLKLRKEGGFRDWSFDQKVCFILGWAAVFYSDPLYPFEFAIRGWFMSFLVSIFEVAYRAIFILFLLFTIDKIRKDELAEDFQHFYLPKFVVVGFWATMSLIGILWARIELEADPVIQISFRTEMSGAFAFFIMAGITYLICVIWVIYLVYKTFFLVRAKPEVAAKFGFIGVPALAIIFIEFIALVSGAFRPTQNHTPIWFTMFLWLNLSFAWLMAWGLWPTGAEEEGETSHIAAASATYAPTAPIGPATDAVDV